MRLLWFAPLLIVAGCAHPVPASQVASIDLCRYMLRGGKDAVVAEEEAKRRNFDCAPYFGALAQQDAAQRAAAANALMQAGQMFQQPYIPPQPSWLRPPQPINCRTYGMGGSLYTSCQ